MSRGIACALASAVLFGASTPLAKLLVSGVSPLLLAGLLYAGSGVGLLLALGVRRSIMAPTSSVNLPQREEWQWLAAATLSGGVVAPIAMMYGLAITSASTASLLLNLEAVFTALLASLAFNENYSGRVAFGMLLIVAGGLVLAWLPGQSGNVSWGVLLIAAACFLWALDNNLTRKVAGRDALMIASVKGLVAGAINVGLALALGAAVPGRGVVAAAAAVGFLGYGVSLVLFVLALRELGSARTGAYFSLAPFFGALVAVALKLDAPNLQLIVAGLLMAVGVWLHLSERHHHLHTHEPLRHSHPHTHDEHHRHTHDSWDGQEPHTHVHIHEPLTHEHPHYPDLHHRHPH